MFCSQCGSELGNVAKFCSACGTSTSFDEPNRAEPSVELGEIRPSEDQIRSELAKYEQHTSGSICCFECNYQGTMGIASVSIVPWVLILAVFEVLAGLVALLAIIVYYPLPLVWSFAFGIFAGGIVLGPMHLKQFGRNYAYACPGCRKIVLPR